jgi:hypothetical protein
MKMKSLSWMLIIIGIVTIIYAMNMDVSVGYGSDRVFNLHKGSQQNNLLMLGGFIFVGGLILFGFSKTRQTPEDEAKEEAENGEWAREIWGTIKNVSGWNWLSKHFSAPKDMRQMRLIVSLFTGVSLGFVSGSLFSLTAGIIAFAAIGLLAYRDIPARQALQKLLAACAVLCVLHTIWIYSMLTTLSEWSSSLFAMAILITPGISAVISVFLYWYIGRLASLSASEENQNTPVDRKLRAYMLAGGILLFVLMATVYSYVESSKNMATIAREHPDP